MSARWCLAETPTQGVAGNPHSFQIEEGFIMKKHKYPLAPMVVGFILAPMLELYLRRSLMRTEGAWLPILSSPIAAICIIGTLILVIFTVRGELKKAKAKAAA